MKAAHLPPSHLPLAISSLENWGKKYPPKPQTKTKENKPQKNQIKKKKKKEKPNPTNKQKNNPLQKKTPPKLPKTNQKKPIGPCSRVWHIFSRMGCIHAKSLFPLKCFSRLEPEQERSAGTESPFGTHCPGTGFVCPVLPRRIPSASH